MVSMACWILARDMERLLNSTDIHPVMRFAQDANGPTARRFGHNTYERIKRQLSQNTRSPQQGREDDFLEPLQRSRTALHLRLKNRALERGVQKMSEFIAVGGGRHVAGHKRPLPAVK